MTEVGRGTCGKQHTMCNSGRTKYSNSAPGVLLQLQGHSTLHPYLHVQLPLAPLPISLPAFLGRHHAVSLT